MALTNSKDDNEKEEEDSTTKPQELVLLPAPLPDELPYIPIGHPDSMMSVESVRRAVEEFRVRPSDVIVATFPKTGTTVVTWICHLLRSVTAATAWNDDDEDALLDFEHLYEVVPWPLLSWDIGYDPNTQQASHLFPRVFKSHLRMASIYRGCRYIVTVRDPLQTTISFYNFLLAKNVPTVLEMDLSTFARETDFVQGRPDGSRGSLWEYYREYHILRDCPSVLVLVYEDIVRDAKASIRTIAKFMDIVDDDGNNNSNSEALIEKVARRSTKEFMARHVSKFDEPYERAQALGRAADLSQLAPGAKVVVEPHRQAMDAAGREFFDRQWRQTMAPLGYENYESFAGMFRTRNEKRFGNNNTNARHV